MKRTISEDMAGAAGAGDAAADVAPEAARRPLRELLDDRLVDALLERSRDQAGGLRLTGEGSMLGELIRAVLERALESELTTHLGRIPHNRHTFASTALAQGVPISEVSHWLGHKSITTTVDLYGHLVPEASGRARDALDGAFAAARTKATEPGDAGTPDQGVCPESAPEAA